MSSHVCELPLVAIRPAPWHKANHDLHGVIEQKVDALLWKHTKEYAVKVDFGHSMMGWEEVGWKMMEGGGFLGNLGI